MNDEMTIEKAKEMLAWSLPENKWPHELARYYIAGYNAAVAKCAEIAKKHERDIELGSFGVCSKEIESLKVSGGRE